MQFMPWRWGGGGGEACQNTHLLLCLQLHPGCLFACSKAVPWSLGATCSFDDYNGAADAADAVLRARGVDLSKYQHRWGLAAATAAEAQKSADLLLANCMAGQRHMASVATERQGSAPGHANLNKMTPCCTSEVVTAPWPTGFTCCHPAPAPSLAWDTRWAPGSVRCASTAVGRLPCRVVLLFLSSSEPPQPKQGCDGTFDCRVWIGSDYWATPQGEL